MTDPSTPSTTAHASAGAADVVVVAIDGPAGSGKSSV